MPFWIKHDKWKITERRGGCIYKTAKIGSEWFECGKGPPSGVDPQNPDIMWGPCSTSDPDSKGIISSVKPT